MHTLMSRTLRLGAALAVLATTTVAAVPASAASGDYTISKSYALGGEGGWDYLIYDPGTKHLFISRSTHVMVVDPASGAVVGDIPDTPGVHGIALAPELGKGFTSNGRDGSITVFDLATLKTTAKIATDGKNPDAIVYEPVSKRVYAFNGGSANATAVDARTNAVVGLVAVGGRPEFAAAGNNGMMYVNIEDKGQIVAIDASKNAVVATWSIAPCEEPTGLAADAKHHRLFAGCSNKIMAVVDADSGKVVATPTIGDGVDATAFDTGTQLALSSNGEGTLTVVHEISPAAYEIKQNATTVATARTLALNPTNHDVYVVSATIKLGPPAAGQTRPTRTMVPGSFTLTVLSRS